MFLSLYTIFYSRDVVLSSEAVSPSQLSTELYGFHIYGSTVTVDTGDEDRCVMWRKMERGGDLWR